MGSADRHEAGRIRLFGPSAPKLNNYFRNVLDFAAIKAVGEDVISQDSVALVFAERYSGKLRYCHHIGAWFMWSGAYWRRDETDLALQHARALARRAAAGSPAKIQNLVRKTSFATGVELFARGDRALAVTSERWDQDPFLLGTPGGTIALRTGLLRDADPADGITA